MAFKFFFYVYRGGPVKSVALNRGNTHVTYNAMRTKILWKNIRKFKIEAVSVFKHFTVMIVVVLSLEAISQNPKSSTTAFIFD